MRDETFTLTSSQLHRYMAEAFRAGADSERRDPIQRTEEAYVRSEHHAKTMLESRIKAGLIARARPTTEDE